MKKKALSLLIVFGSALLTSCINPKEDVAGSSSQTVTGTFAGQGQGTILGATFTVTSTSIKFDCPVGYVIPKVLVDNPPSFDGSVDLTYNGTSNIRILNIQIDPSQTPPVDRGSSFRDIVSGDGEGIDVRETFAETWCVPTSSAKNFSVS